MSLPLLPVSTILAAYATLNGLTWVRLKRQQRVTPGEFALQLSLDTLLFTLLLYHAGGYTNPFVSLFLLPLVISAAILPKIYTWAMAMLTASCYTLLMFHYIPLPHIHMSHEGNDFDLHVLGMWFSFLLNAGLIVFFVVKMASSLRERDQELALAREKALQDEHLVTLGTLATGAAHELGTPLATMAVLAKELGRETDDAEVREKAEIFRQQIDRCKRIISDISSTTGQTRAEGGCRQTIDEYLRQVIEQWRKLRPDARIKFICTGATPSPPIFADKTLTQALFNLLNNAADASPQSIDVHARWTTEQLTLEICDQGPGMAHNVQEAAGTPFFTTKEDGYGLGLYLAHAVINRYRGKLVLTNRPEGGVLAQVIMPLT
jgi:two-component system sensor histidine kinase RegB